MLSTFPPFGRLSCCSFECFHGCETFWFSLISFVYSHFHYLSFDPDLQEKGSWMLRCWVGGLGMRNEEDKSWSWDQEVLYKLRIYLDQVHQEVQHHTYYLQGGMGKASRDLSQTMWVKRMQVLRHSCLRTTTAQGKSPQKLLPWRLRGTGFSPRQTLPSPGQWHSTEVPFSFHEGLWESLR